jgi:nitronate monooxygenase/enoyl-[acyl-carrier protein] reductase II
VTVELRTAVCDVLDIDLPIIQAGMSVHTSPGLAIAVSEAGTLRSLGAWLRPAAELGSAIEEIRNGTDRSFAVNHLPPDLDEESFRLTLAAAPPVISFATGAPGELVARAHDVGSKVTNQVTNVEQAEASAELGVDVIIAQGGEAGGYGGSIATTVLVPQVVERVAPVPVVAAGGLVSGAGLVAALALGASGASFGTRFLATQESPIAASYKALITTSGALEAVKVPGLNRLVPKPGAVGYGTVLRTLRTPFIDGLNAASTDAEFDSMAEELAAGVVEGRKEELLAAAGQSTGLLTDVPSATDVVERIVAEADAVIARLTDRRGGGTSTGNIRAPLDRS